ncbi:MAG: hypothetical protein HZA54_13425 [Planctomycetes bacterium]|nr:hypothetical protein [Planctomycetota bacterium]
MPAGPKVFRCARCEAETVFDPEQQRLACDFCGHKPLTLLGERGGGGDGGGGGGGSGAGVAGAAAGEVAAGGRAAEVIPEFAIPFAVDAEGARRRFLEWLGTSLWYPRSIVRQFHEGEFVAIWVPTYQFTCNVRTEWAPEPKGADGPSTPGSRGAGSPGSDSNVGARPSFLSQEGSHAGYYNERISASRGLKREEVQQLLPYNYREMRPFAGDALSDVKRECATYSEGHCWEVALKNILRSEKSALKTVSGGALSKHLRLETMDRKTFLILVPVWVLGYTYEGRYYRALVNGQSGKVCEVRQLAPGKVGLVVSCVAASLVSGLLLLLSLDTSALEGGGGGAGGSSGGGRGAGATVGGGAGGGASADSGVPVYLRLQPNMTFAGFRGSEGEAGNLTEQIVKQAWQGSRSDLSDTLQQAREIAQAGNPGQAEELLRRVLKQVEERPAHEADAARLRLELGAVLLRAGAAEKAAAEADAILREMPEEPRALALRGAALLRRGDFVGAATAWRGAYEVDSSNAFLLLAAGHLWRLWVGDLKQAQECYRDFLEEPEAAPASRLVGFLLRSLEGKAGTEYTADVVRLVGGGVARGELVGNDAAGVRLRVSAEGSAGGVREVHYPAAEVVGVEKGESELKLEFDKLLKLWDEALRRAAGELGAADLMGLARYCEGRPAAAVQEAAVLFALLAVLADPACAEGRTLIGAKGYVLSNTRLVKKPQGGGAGAGAGGPGEGR